MAEPDAGRDAMPDERPDQRPDERRTHVPFDPFHFEKLARDGIALSPREAFERIHDARHWAGAESVSGEGASRAQTERLERELPALLAELGVRTLLDLPCGDFGWMARVELPVEHYVGGDLLPALIAQNALVHGRADREFVVLDLLADPLPAADLLLCRDCLVHFSFADIGRALDAVRHSGISWLLTTTFPGTRRNEEIVTGDWRPLDLTRPPFGFPPPERLLVEGCTEGGGAFDDKSLGLWRVAALPSLALY